METDEKRRGKEAAALSGGHLCHVCGYQYPNPNPSAKLRRSHRKHCVKAPAPAPAAAVVEEEGAVEGLRVSEREDRNAGEGTLLGEIGGGVEGKTEANGGATLLGSAREVGASVEDVAIAEHVSSDGTGVYLVTHKLNENGSVDCMTTENVSPEVINSEFSRSDLVDCSSNSEHVNEGNGAELPISCTSGSQDEVSKHCSGLVSISVTNPAEREDSFDEYQDASPFLHQSELEDGAVPSSEFSVESNSVKMVLSGSSVAANEIYLGTNGLCKDQVFGELIVNDLSADSKAGNDLENGTPSFSGPEASLKLGVPDESYVDVGSNHTDVVVVDNKPDKRFYHSELISDPDASSIHEAHSVVLDTDSQSTCSRKMQGFMENTIHESHNRDEVSPTPEAAESSNVSSTSSVPVENELELVHPENKPAIFSTELSTQNWPVKDISDVQQPIENSCQKNSCSNTGFENNLQPSANADDMLNSITKDRCSDLDFTFEAMTQRDIVEQVNVAEENSSVQKTSGSSEVCNKQNNPHALTEDQLSKNHKHDVLPMDQTHCVNNPFDLDDARNDDLFELPSKSCYLEVPSIDVSRQQVDSASMTVDQPTVSNATRMAEVQHNSNECILSASSSGENGHPVGLTDMPVSSADVPSDHLLQEDDAHKSDIPFVLSHVAPTDLHTVCTQDTSALAQTNDATAKNMAAVYTSDDTEMKQADDTTATDTYAINVEAKVTQDTVAKMNEAQHCNVQEKQADSTKEVNALQSISNLEENKPTEDTNAMKMNAQINADDLEGQRQTDTSAEKNVVGCTDKFEEKPRVQATSAKEMIAAQSTEKVNENKQTSAIVGQGGNNQKDEIAVPGGRLNSGRIHVPLKVLLAEASAENKVNKPSTKERVLSFRRRVSKNDNSSAKSGSPKSGSGDHHWETPAKLPRKDADKSSKGRKQPWMPFICCHSVR